MSHGRLYHHFTPKKIGIAAGGDLETVLFFQREYSADIADAIESPPPMCPNVMEDTGIRVRIDRKCVKL